MKTAKEILENNIEKSENAFPIWKESDVLKAMKEFAKLHVKAALEAAAENATVDYYYEGIYDVGHTCVHSVEKDSILTAYPDENIK